MKRFLLFSLAFSLIFSVYAQKEHGLIKPEAAKKAYKVQQLAVDNFEPTAYNQNNNYTYNAKDREEHLIGLSDYDHQSNCGMQKRIRKADDGTVVAVFSFWYPGETTNERGTGYNYSLDNGDSWLDPPTERLESYRIGWPSIGITTSGIPTVVSHDGVAALSLVMSPSITDGTWYEYQVPTIYDTPEDILFPRSAVGTDGTNEYLHVFGVTADESFGGGLVEGMDGACLYWRGLINAADDITWEVEDEILDGLSSDYFIGIQADNVAVDARGEVVAVVVGDCMYDVALMKSEDNGDTWTKFTVNDFYADLWQIDDLTDYNSDGIADTIYTTDGSHDVAIDANGMVHVSYGVRYVSDYDNTDETWHYFPYLSDGLMYWNEDMGSHTFDVADPDNLGGEMVAWVQDLNGNDSLDIICEADIAYYGVGLTSHSSISVDDAGNVFIGYDAYMETLCSEADQTFRHVWMVVYDADLEMWLPTFDVTPDDEFAECVFPAISNNIEDKMVHLIYQRDYDPGVQFWDGDEVAVNEIIHIPVQAFTVTFNCDMSGVEDFDPASDVINVTGTPWTWPEPGTKDMLVLTDEDEDMVYSLTVPILAGDHEYKYFMNDGWANGEWEEQTNRELVVDADVSTEDTYGIPVSIEFSNYTLQKVNIYPNPVNGNLYITDIVNVKSVTISNIIGQEVARFDAPESDIIFDTKDIENGIYIVTVYDVNGDIRVQKVMKN